MRNRKREHRDPCSLEGWHSCWNRAQHLCSALLAARREAHYEEGECLLIPQEHGFVWHCVLKGISFAGTMSDVIHSFYEKCKSRFYFFLLRRPVKVGGCDKDLSSARRLKWFQNLISGSCVYKMDMTWDLSPPSPHTLCWARLCWKLDCTWFEVVPSDQGLEILISVAG